MSRKVVLFREDLDHLCPPLVKQRKNPLTISNQRVVYFLLLNCNTKCISLDLCQVFVFCEYVAVFLNRSRVIPKPSPAQPSEGNNDDFLISESASSSISSWVRFFTLVVTFYLFLLRRHNFGCWRHRRSWAIFAIRRIGWVKYLRITEYSFDLRNLCLSLLDILSIFPLTNAFGIESVSCWQSRGADSLDIITSNFNCILAPFFLFSKWVSWKNHEDIEHRKSKSVK